MTQVLDLAIQLSTGTPTLHRDEGLRQMQGGRVVLAHAMMLSRQLETLTMEGLQENVLSATSAHPFIPFREIPQNIWLDWGRQL